MVITQILLKVRPINSSDIVPIICGLTECQEKSGLTSKVLFIEYQFLIFLYCMANILDWDFSELGL